jgi:hypothetical protein
MRQLHLFGPAVLAIAFMVFAVASWRMGLAVGRLSRLSAVTRSAGVVLIVLLVLYSWAFLWVTRVSRYIPQ